MPPNPSPALILVPGAWHSSAIWSKLTTLLTPHYPCQPTDLPSSNSDPSVTLAQDIAAVRNAITSSTSQNRDVVLILHSYAGFVGTSAIKGLTHHAQQENQGGRVLGIVLLASGFSIAGLSFLDGWGGTPPPWWKVDVESGFAVVAEDPKLMFYHDLPVEEGEEWVRKMRKLSLKAVAEGGEESCEGWRDVSIWYLASVDDQVFPAEMQRGMVELARKEGADVTIREVKSGHSAMLSKPKATADFVLEAVEYFVGQKE